MISGLTQTLASQISVLFFQDVEELLYMQELDLSSKNNFAACTEGNLLGHSLEKNS